MAGCRHIVYVYPKDKSGSKLFCFRRDSELDMYLNLMKVMVDVEDYLNMLDGRYSARKNKITWRYKFQNEEFVIKVSSKYF